MDHISHTNIPCAHTLGPARPRFDLATKEGKPRILLPINHVCFDVVAILSCTREAHVNGIYKWGVWRPHFLEF